MTTEQILAEIAIERASQDATWGEQNHPNGTGPAVVWADWETQPAIHVSDYARLRCQRAFAEGNGTWLHILLEEIAEAFAENDPARLRAEMIQVAAVAAAWVEAIDRRSASDLS